MSGPFQVAALFVMPKGVYIGHDRIDAWTEERDARGYAGPWPVVAHPPCERWGRYAGGGPRLAKTPRAKKLGDDGGCFAAALAAVRKYGGVLEHPADSHAWTHFGLARPPRAGGWVAADFEGGWTCCVAQGRYGHPSQKLTWLYAKDVVLPSLAWGACPRHLDYSDCKTPAERRRLQRGGVWDKMPRHFRKSTPIEFRNLLLSIAGSAMWVKA